MNSRIIVSKKGRFDSAHFLPNYPGKCANVHGHSFLFEVAVHGDINESGMVMDFHELDVLVKEVENEFDHHLINDALKMPTAENITSYISMKLHRFCGGSTAKPYSVKVWETPDSCVEMLFGDK